MCTIPHTVTQISRTFRNINLSTLDSRKLIKKIFWNIQNNLTNIAHKKTCYHLSCTDQRVSSCISSLFWISCLRWNLPTFSTNPILDVPNTVFCHTHFFRHKFHALSHHWNERVSSTNHLEWCTNKMTEQ